MNFNVGVAVFTLLCFGGAGFLGWVLCRSARLNEQARVPDKIEGD